MNRIEEIYGKSALRNIFENTEFGSSWNALFQAQHGGIKTTLVDWSARIDRALYFCVEKDDSGSFDNTDGQLWVYLISRESTAGDEFNNLDPHNLEKGMMLNITVDLNAISLRPWESKLNNQFGAFYVSPRTTSNTPLNMRPEIKAKLFRFRIPAIYKSIIREELNGRNINWQTMHVQKKNDPRVKEIIDKINANSSGKNL